MAEKSHGGKQAGKAAEKSPGEKNANRKFMGKKMIIAIAIVLLVAGTVSFLALSGFRPLARMFGGPRGNFGAFGDSNAYFSRIGAALGLAQGATKAQVLEALGLPSDASQQQVTDALQQKGISLGMPGGGFGGDSNSYFARIGGSLGLPAGATKAQVLAALGLAEDATQEQIRNALEQRGIMPARGAPAGDSRQQAGNLPWQ